MITPEITKEILEHYHYLHNHAEVSWKETHTTEYIKSILLPLGFSIKDFDDSTGLFADLGNGNPIVAIRADIDALWQEVDGQFTANHSCGHDAHMSIVIGLAYTMSKKKFNGTLRLIFQPAEEKGEGALKMVEKGAVDNVDYLFGIHLRPIQEIPFGKASPVIVHGAGSIIDGYIKGGDCHGARPHLGSNAIELMSSLNEQIAKIHIDPQVPSSIKMTYIQAGGDSRNVIPGNGKFGIDARAQDNETIKELLLKFRKVVDSIQAATDSEISFSIRSDMPAAIQNEVAIRHASNGIIKTLGNENIVPTLITSGGDDFHFYTIKRPDLKATMIGLGCDLSPGLHHPNMRFNLDALQIGTNILVNTVEDLLDIVR